LQIEQVSASSKARLRPIDSNGGNRTCNGVLEILSGALQEPATGAERADAGRDLP
jgi:hypothetical protein